MIENKTLDGLRENIIDLAECDTSILREIGGHRLSSLDRKYIEKLVYSMGDKALFNLSRKAQTTIPPIIPS